MKLKNYDDPDSLQSDHQDNIEEEGGGGEQYEEDEENPYPVEEENENFGSLDEENEEINFLDSQVNEAIKKRREEKEKAHAIGEVSNLENVDERLGEDFEDSPWVPPSVELAWEYRLKSVYHGGKAKRSKIKLTKATDLGLGVPMYFLFIKTFAITTFFMTLFSLPPLFFAYYGHRIPQQDQDTSGFYRLWFSSYRLSSIFSPLSSPPTSIICIIYTATTTHFNICSFYWMTVIHSSSFVFLHSQRAEKSGVS
jgi:hypothetical protein